MLLCVGCQWQLKQTDKDAKTTHLRIQRFDRIESLYLTTGDYAALQQMNTYFPNETRMLIEDVLHLGQVNSTDINTKFLYFFQDSTLQRMMSDVQLQYSNMDDVEQSLNDAFGRLRHEDADLPMPDIYTQMGSFDQSIIVSDGVLGISLDKYLGEDYPFYVKNYTADQRRLMKRDMIVPDCLAFYLLSLFPLSAEQHATQALRDEHMGRIMWVVNRLLQHNVFDNEPVAAAEAYVKQHGFKSIKEFLQ